MAGDMDTPPFRLSVPAAVVGTVCVGLIIVGLALLCWRWQVRKREMAHKDREFRGSYEKYGIGRGTNPSSCYGSPSSKRKDPYGSFFEVETEKPKKALLYFRPSSATSLQRRAVNYNSMPQWPESTPSFSMKEVPHLPPSAIKRKGISAPLLLANGSAEPWSPAPSQSGNNSAFHGFGALQAAALPQPPPPHTLPATFQQKLKQPQPRSPPATPGTSQKHTRGDSMSVSRDAQRLSVCWPCSDGSLYSRNSFSSSNYDLAAATSDTTSVDVDYTSAKRQQQPLSSSSSSSYTYGGEEVIASPNSTLYNNLPRLMSVIAPFTPTLEDELLLRVGDTVRVVEEYRDAWCLVQLVVRVDSPKGVVPCVCLQERKRIVLND